MENKSEKKETKKDVKVPDFKEPGYPIVLTNAKGEELLSLLGDIALRDTWAEIYFRETNGDDKFRIRKTDEGDFDIYSSILSTGADSVLRINTTSGKMGIGTTNPGAKLEVNSSTAGAGSLQLSSNEYVGEIKAKCGSNTGILYLSSDVGIIRAYTDGVNSSFSLWNATASPKVRLSSFDDSFNILFISS